MTDWPPHYVKLPFPVMKEVKQSWHGTVADRARITDPDFHGGKTEAIRLIVEWREEKVPLPPALRYRHGALGTRRVPVIGEWIEFRNFKEANDFVQAYKRLSR